MAKEVKIYTTPSCVYCKMAKDFFQKTGVSYKEIDVMNDVQGRQDMIDKSGQLGVPVIEVDGSIVVGFDKPRLQELLGS